MNYLAHIYLSGPDPDIQVGGFLGDFVKGPLPCGYPDKIEAGIKLHRRIDRSTDEHPAFRQRLTEFPPPWRRFGGILLDVYFDHLLASRWRHYHDQPLDDYCLAFYRHLQHHHDLLPERAKYFSRRAPQTGWLENYANADMIPPMLNNLGQRLKRPVALGEAWPELTRRRQVIEHTFQIILNHHREMAHVFLQEKL